MFYSSENTLTSALQEIETFWHSQVINGFINEGNHKLAYAYVKPEQAKTAIVISSGRIESLLKYKELIWELYQNNLAVFIVDHIGQGLSSRKLANSHKGHIQSFEHYADDLSLFIKKIVNNHWSGQKVLLAHSMGAAIAVSFFNKHKHDFNGAIFSAPMFDINNHDIPRWFAKSLLFLCSKLGLANQYVPGQADYQDKPFSLNELTHSKIRYKIFRACYQTHPEIQLGGVTIAWLNAALKIIKQIKNSQLILPSLILQAGADSIVSNPAQNHFHQNNPLSKLITIDNAKHELLCEKDNYRKTVMTHIYNFVLDVTTDKGS